VRMWCAGSTSAERRNFVLQVKLFSPLDHVAEHLFRIIDFPLPGPKKSHLWNTCGQHLLTKQPALNVVGMGTVQKSHANTTWTRWLRGNALRDCEKDHCNAEYSTLWHRVVINAHITHCNDVLSHEYLRSVSLIR
jgi:hypothetical protein